MSHIYSTLRIIGATVLLTLAALGSAGSAHAFSYVWKSDSNPANSSTLMTFSGPADAKNFSNATVDTFLFTFSPSGTKVTEADLVIDNVTASSGVLTGFTANLSGFVFWPWLAANYADQEFDTGSWTYLEDSVASATTVPEPESMILLLSGLLLAGVSRRLAAVRVSVCEAPSAAVAPSGSCPLTVGDRRDVSGTSDFRRLS